MHIVLLVIYYPPNTSSAAKLMQDLAERFGHLGHRVTVLTADDTLDRPYAIEENGPLAICRVRTGRIYGAGSLIFRALREIALPWTFWRKAGRFLRSLSPDAFVYYVPSIFFAPLVRRLKKLWGVRTYLIQRDFFPDWAVEAGVMGKGPHYWYFKHREKMNYDAADRIAVQSPANIQYFRQKYPARNYAVEVLYNWTDDVLPPRRVPSHRSRLGLDGKVVFFYGGNIGRAQDFDNILRLAEAMKSEPSAHFLLVGPGSEVAHVRAEIARRKLGNVTLCDAVPQDEYLAMLQEFDIGLISLHPGIKSANVPGKLLGYLQCGMPTLASVNPGNDLAELLTASGAGFVSVNPDDAAFLRHARALARDAELRAQMGARACRLLRERFHVQIAARQILDYFQSAGS